MISKDTVYKLLEEKLVGDLFLVDLTISSSNVITVVVDSDTSVNVDTCIELSRQVEHNLDRESEDFELTVYSAGVGEPLQLPRQYNKNLGRDLDVVTSQGEKYIGVLKEADQDKFVIEVSKKERVEGKKKKVVVTTEHTFPYADIKTAKVVVSFK
ncbi:ribosome assembly cofactor RimP [Halosquirtibacter xylanolyticus]|uniref:ribosome assembly cofactor RimP n=1 Tax=Halosquirtibacter xylanolyticus TaxID=3374599 RepID=UPI0037499216|nr:ribosome assembly cofactor RimP [Prolixibacteraceae bacterium]